MGGLFSGYGKKQRKSKDILEELEVTIKTLTESKRSNVQYERNFIGYLLILSFFTYLIGALVYYLYFLPTTWLEGLLHTLPLVLFPIIVYLIKKLLNMYFSHRTTQLDARLRTLHEEKRKVLNEVMEKETYKTARELLERFDPTNPSLQVTPARPQRANRAPQSELRQRNRQTPHPALMQHRAAMATPQAPRPAPVAMTTPAVQTSSSNQEAAPVEPLPTPQPSLHHIPPGMCVGAAPGPPTPCPILPRSRSNVDKMVEYLVGDGPNNRYALVCSDCKSHNGMALRDEFEYITFRCAYCYSLNPARKKRPSLQPAAPLPQRERTASEDNGAEAVFSGDGNHDNNQHSSRRAHRSRGQRSSSQTSEGNSSPTPPDQ